MKWGGQVVATRRLKSIPEPFIRFDQKGDETDDENLDNMLADTPQPGQPQPDATPAESKKINNILSINSIPLPHTYPHYG